MILIVEVEPEERDSNGELPFNSIVLFDTIFATLSPEQLEKFTNEAKNNFAEFRRIVLSGIPIKHIVHYYLEK